MKHELIQGFQKYADLIYDLVPEVHACWVGAFIMQESEFDENAMRRERGYILSGAIARDRREEWLVRMLENGWTFDEVNASYGLMQLMVTTAWDRGWEPKSGEIIELANPVLNIYFGWKHLKWLLQRYHDDRDPKMCATVAFNRGSAKFDAVGKVIATDYAKSVLNYERMLLNALVKGQVNSE